MLERILCDAERDTANAFGFLLTAESLEPHLARLAHERQRYRRSNPGDLALLAEVRQSLPSAEH